MKKTSVVFSPIPRPDLLELLFWAGKRVVLHGHDDETAYKKLEPGDILAVSRSGNLYEHYGVYIGEQQVIHLSGNVSASVCQVSMEDFRKGSEYRIIDFPEKAQISGYHLYSAEETVERAKSSLGKTKSLLSFTNSEHFAYWCKTGVESSSQVEALKKIWKWQVPPGSVMH